MSQTPENNMLTFLKEHSRVLVKGKIPGLSSFRYFKRWSYLVGKDPLTEKQPWITFSAIDFIGKNIRSTDKVFEYGGGGSTVYFLNKVSELVTVEHDKEWFQMLKKKFDIIGSERWQGHLILPEQGVDTTNLDKSVPEDYYSEDPGFQDATFRAYSTFISHFEDEYFDWVLIDGRARTSCLFHAMPKVKTGGYIVLDNSERKYYLQNNLAALQKKYKLVLNNIGPVPYSPYFSKTSVWQRIK